MRSRTSPPLVGIFGRSVSGFESPLILVTAACFALVLNACSSERSAQAEPAPEPTPNVIDLSGAGSCGELDQHDCLNSGDCTLHHEETNVYSCRPAEGACEEDLVQTDRAACEAREGCSHDPGSCFCPVHGHANTKAAGQQGGPSNQDADCTCGGGPPPSCSPSE